MMYREVLPLPNGLKLFYQITLPSDYKAGEKLPMIVFLHGAGERGHDYERLCNTAHNGSGATVSSVDINNNFHKNYSNEII